MSEAILVVDDQKNMCWVLSKVLSEAGFSVETARSAKEAMSIISNGNISAAIIDYRLPDKDGFKLFLEMRRQKHDIPALLITSYGSKEIREEALRLGFSAYFDKPFENRALVSALKKALKEVGK